MSPILSSLSDFISPIPTFFLSPSNYLFLIYLKIVKFYFLPFLALVFQVVAPSI